MDHGVDAMEGVFQSIHVPHITQEQPESGIGEPFGHLGLFPFVTGQAGQPLNVGVEQVGRQRITQGTCDAGDEDGLHTSRFAV